MKFFKRSAKLPFLVCAGALSLCAQTDSRVAEIAAQQEQKATDAKPDEPGKVERAFLTVREHDWVQRITAGVDGFGAKARRPGAGDRLRNRPAYRRTDLLDGQLTFRASAIASLRGSRKFDLELAAPKLSGGRYFAEFYAVHHNYPRLSYYGPGPDSQKTGRTDFRLEDTAFDGTFGSPPGRST